MQGGPDAAMHAGFAAMQCGAVMRYGAVISVSATASETWSTSTVVDPRTWLFTSVALDVSTDPSSARLERSSDDTNDVRLSEELLC